MNRPSTHSQGFQIKDKINHVLSLWAHLYKVYANIEIDKTNSSGYIDVIDGYLKSGEELQIQSIHYFTEHKTKIVSLEIVQNHKKNTYLRIGPIELKAAETKQVLVCIYKENQVIGYQLIDLFNTILGEPKFDPNKLISFK
jgi:hypothetical protein